MALDASVIGFHIVHARGIENVAARGMFNMVAAGSVAAPAADVPLQDLLGMNVVVDGVAAIAGGAGGTLHIVWRIERFPPIRSFGYKVGTPNVVGDIPLRRLRKIVIANSCEVALLPEAAVDECYLVLRELGEEICGEIGNDGLGMLTGIPDDVGHGRLLPALVDLLVAFFAGQRARVVRGSGRCLLRQFLAGRQLAQVADEENEFPAIVVLFFVRMAPGGHARETDAVLDDVADLAIGKILRLWQAQIWRLGVEVPADLGLAAAVVAVAGRAAVDVTVAGLIEDLRRGFQGIVFMARGGWDGQIPDGTSDELFQSGWLVQGAEATANQDGCIEGSQNPEHDKYKEKFFPAFHAYRPSAAGRVLRTAVQTGEPH